MKPGDPLVLVGCITALPKIQNTKRINMLVREVMNGYAVGINQAQQSTQLNAQLRRGQNTEQQNFIQERAKVTKVLNF